MLTEALKRAWRSPIYTFFTDNVTYEVHEGRPCHFFKCAARLCKTKAGGVRRYQDSKDQTSTANLKHHAMKCFGADAVATSTNVDPSRTNSSIFAQFARQGQKPVQYSHRSHSNPEVRFD
jgi:hypothetical protein